MPVTPPAAPPPPFRWGVNFGAWTAFGLVVSAQHYLTFLMSRGTAEPWSQALLLMMPVAWVWALVTPVILRLGRRFPISRGRLLAHVPVHAVLSMAFVFFLTLGYAWYRSLVLPPATPQPLLRGGLQLFVGWAVLDGLLYWMVLGVGHMLERERRFRERELSASQLETQLAQANLQALKAQLQPHFLFNALHTIGALVRTGDRDNAVKVVAGLGDLLRRMLEGQAQQQVPLSQELAFVRSYLEIERIRFRDRLTVQIDAAPDMLEAKVPHLILQPLVENAIRHGVGARVAGGAVSVVARRVGERLELLVKDDGPGLGETEGTDETEGTNGKARGIGIANTRERLAKLYGADFDFVVANVAGGGVEARVTIPLRVTWFGAASAA